jgi:Xaa-Pro dipeptidase
VSSEASGAHPGWDRQDAPSTNEPGIYIPGEFSLRLEDDMMIEEHGAEPFTLQSPSIDDPFPGLPTA